LRIKAADIEEPRKFWREQIKNCVACMRVAPCRDETGWFVYDNM